MPLRLTRYTRTFKVDDATLVVLHETFTDSSRSTLTADGVEVAADGVGKGGPDPLRNHTLRWEPPGGGVVEVEVGPANAWTFGLRARRDGVVVFETHPGRPLGFGPRLRHLAKRVDGPEATEQQARNAAAWKRNWPSLATDITLGLAFFFVAREFGLVTAAVSGAVAGLVLWGVQKWIRVDLLGGLAVFGIAMGLLSAAFALAFQDERFVQHRGTLLGVIGALPFLADGLFRQGQLLAVRLARYLAFEVDAARLGVAMGLIGLVSASMNAAAVALLSRDAWLVFSTFLDVPIVMAMFLLALGWVRRGPNPRLH
jgi:intracellular septation protein A